MVERSGRAKGKSLKQKLLGSHQRCWIWGRNLVCETLRGGNWPILELYLANDLAADELRTATELAGTYQTQLHVEDRERLTQLAHTAEHQGYLAKMPPFPYLSAEKILQQQAALPLYLILDSIQDPYNLGAMLRSAEVFGVDGVFIGTERQVGVTSLVARSSAGAVSRVPLAQALDLVQLATTLRSQGIFVAGASETGSIELSAFDFRRPAAVVIGNEGAGISAALRACCDAFVRIHHAGAISSLNAAAAAAVVLYEAGRQRKEDGL